MLIVVEEDEALRREGRWGPPPIGQDGGGDESGGRLSKARRLRLGGMLLTVGCVDEW